MNTTNPEIDYNYLVHSLSGYRFPRNKISSLINKGELIRVKKGVYVKSDGTYSLPVLANLVYGPSYVSQEYALQLYSLIPERVHAVTSMTLGRKKTFSTPVGMFTYEPLPEPFYPLGIRRVELGPTRAFLIATPEKALVDIIWKRRDLKTAADMEQFLVDDQRVDLSVEHMFSLTRMRELERTYDRPAVKALASVLTEKVIRR